MQIVTTALQQYGATLNSDSRIQLDALVSGVVVVVKGKRLRFESASGNLLASGPVTSATVEKFVERFWGWEKAGA